MNMNEKQFVEGVSFRERSPKAPDWLKMKGSFNRLKLIGWLSSRTDEWVNFDIKLSKKGTLYAEVNDWKKEGGTGGGWKQAGEWEGRSQALESLQKTGDIPAEEIRLEDIPF
jgi:hypothetical protein